MIAVLWEFQVQRGRERKFERIYGPSGDWARLFRRARGYQGTQLLRDPDRKGRYVTVDLWTSEAAFHNFKTRFAAPYHDLDKECESLTRHETKLGSFRALQQGSEVASTKNRK